MDGGAVVGVVIAGILYIYIARKGLETATALHVFSMEKDVTPARCLITCNYEKL